MQHPIPPTAVTRTYFLNQLGSILDETREMRHGPQTYVLFRTYRNRRRVDLRYSEKYGRVAKELGLFSAALRQPDFLAEYLGYYRVIESVTKTNGKDWIAHALQRLVAHRWPKILLGHEHAFEQKPRNIIGICLRRASIRLKQLHRQLGGSNNIAHYLYNVNRCGIAHGKDAVVRGDITPTYFDVARDSMILKLLARMAIDEKR